MRGVGFTFFLQEMDVRQYRTCARAEFVEITSQLDFHDNLMHSLNDWEGGDTCESVEYSVDSLGRIDSLSSPFPLIDVRWI